MANKEAQRLKRERIIEENGIIFLDNVSKSYSTGSPALNGVTLSIGRGEFVFIVGDSGSGKSTLIKLLLRELTATSGSVYVMGNDLARLKHRQSPRFRRNLGVVFQDFRLLNDRNVYENVAFYRKKMDDMGVEPGDIKGIEDIGKLPFTTKEDLRANYPFGLLAVPQEKIVRVQGTSGTTGKLTLASYTEKDVDVWGECVARGLTMAGLNAADRIHICYGYGLFTGGLGLDFGARKLGAMAIPMSAGNTKRQLMCMEDFGATAFACTPSYALYLGEAAKEAGVVDRLQLKVGINGAEPWTDEMRRKIEELLNVNSFDIYGLCEITGPGVALDCIHHKGMHVQEDYFYPEVLNPTDHTPCKDGETGELVFTTLVKEGMPLLRYRTKDLTSIDHSKCECGRTLPRIHKFTGRTDDMKVIRGVNVFPTQVETALLSMGGGVAPHYMDVLTVEVEVDEKYFSDEIRKLDGLRNRVAATLKQALGVAVNVKLVEPKTIQRSEGKAKRVIDNRDM